jgi:hypothetical protein
MSVKVILIFVGCLFSLTANVLALGLVADLEALTFNLTLMFI